MLYSPKKNPTFSLKKNSFFLENMILVESWKVELDFRVLAPTLIYRCPELTLFPIPISKFHKYYFVLAMIFKVFLYIFPWIVAEANSLSILQSLLSVYFRLTWSKQGAALQTALPLSESVTHPFPPTASQHRHIRDTSSNYKVDIQSVRS